MSDPIQHAEDLILAHFRVHKMTRDLRASFAAKRPDLPHPYPIPLTDEALARRIISDFLNHGWAPPKDTDPS